MFGLGLALGLGLRLGFEPSSPIVCELVLSLMWLSFLLVRFRHNPGVGPCATSDSSVFTSNRASDLTTQLYLPFTEPHVCVLLSTYFH